MNRKSYSYLLILFFVTSLSARMLSLSLGSLNLSEQTYYINQQNPGSPPTGTKENPFGSLEDAVNAIDADDIEILLLGEELLIESDIFLPHDVNLKIK